LFGLNVVIADFESNEIEDNISSFAHLSEWIAKTEETGSVENHCLRDSQISYRETRFSISAIPIQSI
jgi:hypothetical protein